MQDTIDRFITTHELTGRQAQVLRMFLETPHRSSSEIGQDLKMAEATVNVHFSKIFLKVKCRNKMELLAVFQRFQSEVPNETPSSRTLSILLVEDDIKFQELLLGALRSQPNVKVEALALNDGREAIEHLSRVKIDDPDFMRPDLIILDLIMPRMDGLSFLSKVKADKALQAIPCVVFSSELQQESVNRAYEQGAASFLRKPLNDIELKRIVDTLLTIWGQFARSPVSHKRLGA